MNTLDEEFVYQLFENIRKKVDIKRDVIFKIDNTIGYPQIINKLI